MCNWWSDSPQTQIAELRPNDDVCGRTESALAGKIPHACAIPRYGLLALSRNAWMAALTEAARDAGTSGVGNWRQIASVRFSASQAARQ